MQRPDPGEAQEKVDETADSTIDLRPVDAVVVGGGDGPPNGGIPTLTIPNPQPRLELKPYIPDKQRDYVRLIVTVGLLLMLGWVVVWSCIESASWAGHWAQTKEMLQTVLPALTGLMGSVIGFYFGSGVNSLNTTNASSTGDSVGK